MGVFAGSVGKRAGLTGVPAVWLLLGAFIKHPLDFCGFILSPSGGGVGKLAIECSQIRLAEKPVILKSRHLIGR